MKTSQQIIGLPVVSISDGNEIGKVKNVIINAVKGTVDFFIIDSGIRSLAGGVIPVAKVLGIGEYALTIMEPDDISDIVKIPTAIDLLQKNITVRGTRVLTKRGSLLGETGDLLLEENEDCRIVGVEFVPAAEGLTSGIIPKNCIITFGKDLLVVENDFLEKLVAPLAAEIGDVKKLIPAAETAPALPASVEPNILISEVLVDSVASNGFEAQASAIDTALSQPETEQASKHFAQEEEDLTLDRFVSDFDLSKAADVILVEEAGESVQELQAEPDLLEATDSTETVHMADLFMQEDLPDRVAEAQTMDPELETAKPFDVPIADTTSSKPSSTDLFSERQKQFLRGRRVTKTIKDSNGQIVVGAGETITDEIIDNIKKAEKLVELVMNNEP